MDILLLHVACFALEGGIAWPPVDEHAAGYDTRSDAVSENVKKSCFPGTGNALGFILC